MSLRVVATPTVDTPQSATIYDPTAQIYSSMDPPPASSQSISRSKFDRYKRIRDHHKWGFVIYRCDYRDDEVWKMFLANWSDRVTRWLLSRGDSDLAASLEFTIKEDRTKLDGATVEQVQEIFTAWTNSYEAIAEGKTAREMHGAARYDYCIHVDAKALDGSLEFENLPEDVQRKFITRNKKSALGPAAHVNVVRRKMEVLGSYEEEGEEYEEDSDDEVDLDPVAIKFHYPEVYPDVYVSLTGSGNPWEWMARDLDKYGVYLG